MLSESFFTYKSKIYNDKIKNNWVYLLFSKPQLYLLTLIFNTFIIGVITLSLTWICIHYGWSFKVPTSAHQLVGVAIGLLLVFRTQTAYERWSSASKNFNDIYNSLVFITFKIENSLRDKDDINTNDFRLKIKSTLKELITEFSHNFILYLQSEDSIESEKLEKAYLEGIKKLLYFVSDFEKEGIMLKNDVILLQRCVGDIINSCGSCVKIKNTPIPISYALHIKVSIFLYILSLPFGLFSDLGLWSTVMVMFIYYIIAGIEIISREIENPFHDDPNDLPIEKYVLLMQQIPDNHMN